MSTDLENAIKYRVCTHLGKYFVYIRNISIKYFVYVITCVGVCAHFFLCINYASSVWLSDETFIRVNTGPGVKVSATQDPT